MDGSWKWNFDAPTAFMTMSKMPNCPAVSVPIMTHLAASPCVQSFTRPVSVAMLASRENIPPEPPAPEEGEEPVELKTYCRHGVGRSTCAGGVYDGEWVQDAMEGAGVFEYVSGAKYEGNWKANKYDGAGTYVWPDGSKYQGEFVENVMHGKGTFVDKDGREWIGDFYNNTGPGLKLIL